MPLARVGTPRSPHASDKKKTMAVSAGDDDMKTIGVVGLGEMGLPIAGHIDRKTDKAVVGYDVAPAARQRAATQAIDCVDNVEALVARTDGLIVLVGTDDQLKDFLTGPAGVFGYLGRAEKPLGIAVSSTVAPRTMEDLVSVSPQSARLVDVPLARAAHAAVDGTLLGLFGGPAAEFEKWADPFAAFCTDLVHVGDVGAGQVAKTLNNYLLWACVCANAEALYFGGRYGCDPTELRKALLLGSGANWALDTWEKTRPMPWAEEDMAILNAMAGQFDVDLPFARQVETEIAKLKERKRERGMAGDSMNALIAVLVEGGVIGKPAPL